jgi:hypothetical protein
MTILYVVMLNRLTSGPARWWAPHRCPAVGGLKSLNSKLGAATLPGKTQLRCSQEVRASEGRVLPPGSGAVSMWVT